MINNNYLRLIDKLIDATKENRLSWQQSSRDGEFIVEVNSYSIGVLLVQKSMFSIDLERTAFCTISIINEDGILIDSCKITSKDEGYENAVTLYSEAKRSFYKVDDVLNELTESL